MTDPHDRPPQQASLTPPSPPIDYAPPGVPPRRTPLRNFIRFTSGVFAGFVIVFIPTFFAGGEAFEGTVPKWAWPAVIAAALLCAAYAWFVRRRNPPMSAGIWVGTGLCLLLAGACFTGM
jgi:hypothetical protein